MVGIASLHPPYSKNPCYLLGREDIVGINKMWQDTLSFQGIDNIQCLLDAPRITSIRIVRKKRKKKKWDEWDVLEKMLDLQEAVEEGKLEVSKQSFMIYLSGYFAGLNEELYMSVCEKNLGDYLGGVVQAFVCNGYEVNKPPTNIGDDNLLDCRIFADSVESVSGDQSKAVDFIVGHDEVICAVLLKALFESFRDFMKNGKPMKGFKEKPTTVEAMRTLCTCEGVCVSDESYQGMAYTEFSFSVVWLGPDQWLMAVMHGDRLVHMGGSGDNWEDPEA